jgi:hypothetical protein
LKLDLAIHFGELGPDEIEGGQGLLEGKQVLWPPGALQALGKQKPFLIVYYGSDAAGGWQSLDRPLRTLTTLDRFGLVTWKEGVPFLRMLQVPEIMRAMGFKETDKFRFTGTRREQIKQLGNGVCPPVMEAVVQHLCMIVPQPEKRPAKVPKKKSRVPVLG